MANESWWGLAPELSGALEAAGWSTNDPTVQLVVPPVARGGSAVIVAPPSPAAARPALAAALNAGDRPGWLLILAAPAMVEVLGRTVAGLARGTELRIVTAHGPARASRLIASGQLDVLIASPATALALHTRSALKADTVRSLLLAWPGDWDADEALTLLGADLPRDAQRIILSADPDQTRDLAERYARRAALLTLPRTAPVETAAEPAMPINVRTVPVSWNGRVAAIAGLLEAADPEQLTIWTADVADHAALADVAAEVPAAALTTQPESALGMVVCYDVPSAATLARFAPGSDVVLLVAPGTEGHVARIAPLRRPVRLASAIDELRDRDAALRSEVVQAMLRSDLDAAVYAVAPLFERHDAQQVAAACYALWRRAAVRPGVAAEPAQPQDAPARQGATPVGGVATARIWVGVGRRDEATTGDLVAVLAREVGLTREAIGRIELRETFSLVEVPAADAERVARGLTGLTVRRRKLTARVDRGVPARSDRDRGDRDRGGPPRGGPDRGGNRPPRR